MSDTGYRPIGYADVKEWWQASSDILDILRANGGATGPLILALTRLVKLNRLSPLTIVLGVAKMLPFVCNWGTSEGCHDPSHRHVEIDEKWKM